MASSEFKEYLLKIKTAKSALEDFLFKDELDLGLFIINIAEFKTEVK
jgi:hypothetical protein